MTKICSKCKEEKSIIFFHKSNQTKDGYKTECKSCRNKYSDLNAELESRHWKDVLLLCKKCKIFKTSDNFYNDIGQPHRDFFGTECKECQTKRKQIYRRATVKEDFDKIISSLLHGCKSRVNGKTKKGNYKGKELSITKEDIINLYNKQQGLCAISGIKMTFIIGAGKQSKNISTDRIDNSKGYIKENIQLVCSHINIMRGALDKGELIEFCKQVVSFNKSGEDNE